jgi:mRNA interferase MazF
MHRADLGEAVGSEPANVRPIVVVQANHINRSAFKTVVAVGVTSNLAYAKIPGNVLVPKDVGLLQRDSVICVAHVVALDKDRFRERIGEAPDIIMDEIAFGLALVLGLN